MSGFKNFLKGKKKSSGESDKKKDKNDKRSSSTSLAAAADLSGGGSSLNLAGSAESLGYLLKEKDLSKFLKAAWQGDLNKLKQASSGKKFNWNETDKGHRTALHLACAKGHEDIVEHLLKYNSDLNKSDSDGKTPLMKACEISHSKIVDLLLRSGAETNIYDVNKMSAMHITAANGDADIGEMLANRDAKLDSTDVNQVTPLHLSCALGHLNFVEYLVSEYVQVNCTDNQKRTPLMAACIDGHFDIVKLLLEQEADPTMTDLNNQTAVEIADENNNSEISTYIKNIIEKKHKKAETSPSGSIHSKTSIHEMFSPKAQALKDILSPTTSPQNIVGNIFGGPAANVGDESVADKTEDSQSEDLADDSWGDTDTESEFDKKPKGINISAILKKNEDKKGIKDLSDIPENTDEVKSDLTTQKGNAPNTSADNKNKDLSDSESKWDDSEDEDDKIEKDFLTGKTENTEEEAKASKVNKESSKPANLDMSADSIEFDSSMPDDSFGDLPLSDMDKKNQVPASKLFLEKIKEKNEKKDEDSESEWDSSIVNDRNDFKATNTNSDIKGWQENSPLKDKDALGISKEAIVANKDKTDNKNSNEESDWDSESEVPTDDEQNEKVLPPKTPEPGSDFELSSSGDENDSDFSIDDIINKKTTTPTVHESDATKTDVLQALSPRLKGDTIRVPSSESENDDIEQQMLNMSLSNIHTTESSKPKPSAMEKTEKIQSSRNKQLADLGLDLGSDVSSVSDPDGLDNSTASFLKIDTNRIEKNNKGGRNDKVVVDRENLKPLESKVDDGRDEDIEDHEDGIETESESESEWEREQKQKRLAKTAADNNKSINSHPTKTPSPQNKLKTDVTVGPTKSEKDDAEDGEDDDSSDFSLSEEAVIPDVGNPVEQEPDISEDATEAELLKQMQGAEASIAKKNTSPTQGKDDHIKAELQSILERTKSPEQIFQENREFENVEKEKERLAELEKIKENEKREIEMKKRKEELEQMEASRLRKLEEEEQLRRGNLEKEENERLQALREKEKQLTKESEKLLNDRREKAESEENRQKELLQQEIETRRQLLEQEEEERLKALKLEEDRRRKALETEEETRRQDLEKREVMLRESLQEQEDAMKLKLETKENKLKQMDSEAEKRRLELEECEAKLAELQGQAQLIEKDIENKKGEKLEKSRTMEKDNDEEQERPEQIEKEAELRQNEIKERIRKLEEEENKLRVRLNEETAQFENSREEYELQSVDLKERLKIEEKMLKDELQQQLEEEETARKRKLSNEYKAMYDSLQTERAIKLQEIHDDAELERQRLLDELSREEEQRRRKLSEEGRKFREALEREREQTLNDIFNRTPGPTNDELGIDNMTASSEQEFVARMKVKERELEEMMRSKEQGLEDQIKAKERDLDDKMRAREQELLRDMEHKQRTIELEASEKLRLAEQDRRTELDRKERELLSRMEAELSRQRDELELSKEQEYNNRFHEVEREARKREQELELQLMELRDKQMRNDTGLSPPQTMEEVIITSVMQGTVNSANVLDNLEDFLSPVEEIPDYSSPPLLDQNELEDKATQSSAPKVTTKRAMKEPETVVSSPISHKLHEKMNAKRISTPNKSKKSPFRPLLSDIHPISSSNHDYTFDTHQSRFLKGSSTPALVGFSDETADLFDELQEAQRNVDIFREKASMQERAKRVIESEMEEMQRTIDSLGQSQYEKEKIHLDVELELQTVKYKLEQETESKTVAERLCNQLRDQLARTEKKLMRETETRQTADMSYRKLQSEIKLKEQQVAKLKEELNELQLALETETNSRSLQEQLYQEQLRQHEIILSEAQRTSHSHVQALSKLEVLNENRKQAESTTDILKMEVAKLKGELTRTTSLLEEKTKQLEHDRVTWSEKLQMKTEALAEAEKKLYQIQLQFENEKMNKQTFEAQLSMKYDSETNTRQQLDAEILSLKSRLENANREIDRLGVQKSGVDQELLRGKESHLLEKSELEKELAMTKQQLQMTEDKLESAEKNLQRLNGELRESGVALAERRDEIAGKQRNFEETTNVIKQLEQSVRDEKLLSNKLENKLESANEKIGMLQQECDKLQRDLNKANEEITTSGKENAKRQEALNSTLNDMKDKSQDERTKLLLRNEQNNLLIEKLEMQLRQKEENVLDNNSQLKRLTQELQQAQTHLANLETEKNVYIKERESLLAENTNLRHDMTAIQKQVDNLENENSTVQLNLQLTESELEKSKEISKETNIRLAAKSTDIEKLKNANGELNGTLQEIKNQNIQIEADLREEKSKSEMLLLELRDANEARENLEHLLGNIKGSNALLEEKLHAETLNRSQREREAEEHKGLWESEVKSRSKIGAEMLDMEKKVQQMKEQIEEEKKKTRKVAEMKKTSDNKIEILEQRSVQHQKEVSALRNKLKQYQRKLKSYEGGAKSVFDEEKQLMVSTVTKLRRQIDLLNTRLTQEQQLKNAAEENQRNQLNELTDLKTKEKVQVYEIEKLETKNRALETELAKQKEFYEKYYICRDGLEEFKHSLETKCRLDLNKKLQEVNLHLEEQALAREAFDKIRNDKEKKTRREFEDTIYGLKSELNQMRTSLHVGLAKRDTSETEAKRFKDMFETERSSNEKLSDRLHKTTERLTAERKRVNYLVDETLNKSNIAKQLFDDSLTGRERSISPKHFDDLETDFDAASYRPKLYSTPTPTGRSVRIHSPEKDLLLSSVRSRNLFT